MSHGFDTKRLDRIPAFLAAKYVDSDRLPHAATLVSRRGEIAHLSCIGEARPGEALKEDAIFRIASMTKPITSIAFMMLVEEGKVALSDPLVKFCPEFRDTGVFVAGGGNVPFLTRPPVRPILMVDLLRHTSGLTYGFQERTPVDAAYRKTKIDDFDAAFTMDSFIEGLAKIPLQFDPGAQDPTQLPRHRAGDLGKVSLAHAIRRVHQPVGELAIIGEQQQAFAVGVETTDVEKPLGTVLHQVADARPPLRVRHRAEHPARFVDRQVAGRGSHRNPSTVNLDDRPGGVDPHALLAHDAAINFDAALRDELLARAP